MLILLPAINAAVPAVTLNCDSIYFGPNTEMPIMMNVSAQAAPLMHMNGMFVMRFHMARGKSLSFLRHPDGGVYSDPLWPVSVRSFCNAFAPILQKKK